MNNSIKMRFLSLLLCVLMLMTMIPVQVYAMAGEALMQEDSAADSEALSIKNAKAHMDALLKKYLGTNVMAEDEVAAKIAKLSDAKLISAWNDANELVAEVNALTDAEFYLFAKHESTETFGFFYGELKEIFDGEVKQFGTNITLLDGALSISDTANKGSGSGTSYTATANGSLFSKATNTITIANDSGATANLRFDYSTTNANSFTINGASASASGSYNEVLQAGGTVVIYIQSKSGLSGTKATLNITNISLSVAASESDVTFEYDSAYGSVTVGGTAVSSGTTQSVTLADGVALVATPKSGATFLGWVDGTGAIISKSASFTIIPSAAMTVKAVFIGSGSAPHFGVGKASQTSESVGLLGLQKRYYHTVTPTHIYSDLNTAIANAAGKTIVLLNSGTLSAGTYTIPSNVTLLIPFDASNTMYTTEAVSTDSYTTPTVYRTLTLADGANLVVNGAVSVSAKHFYAGGAKPVGGGSPTGAVAFIKMQGSSNITVNKGGALYAYGFITGSGSVTANSGATVYENFQMMDFRGGTQSTEMENGVFPISQYYVQNIEVPMTLYSGAVEYSYTSIFMSKSTFGSAVKFIASSGAMFNLTSGYVIKKYNGTNDRLEVESHGDMKVSPITMEVGTSDINSKDYDLGINQNITLRAVTGNIEINQDIALLPGAKIIVEKDAKCTLGQGNSIYVYDADQWGNFCGPKNTTFTAVAYAPGRTYTRVAADIVDAEIVVNGTVDASRGYLYCTAGGANVRSEGSGVIIAKPGTQTVTYQLVQGTGYTNIPLTSGVLKNADGTTLKMTSPSGTYTYDNGVWTVTCEHQYTSAVTKEATCTAEGIKTYTCPCGHSYTEAIAMLAHTPGAEATCETAQICTVCKKELVAALGHADETVTVPAGEHTLGTVTTACSRCGKVSSFEYIDATNGLIIYVDTTKEEAGAGTADAPFNSLAAAIEYANGQFDATIVLLSDVTVEGTFVEAAHAGAFVITADGGALTLADGAVYKMGGTVVFDALTINATNALIAACFNAVKVEASVSVNGTLAVAGGDNAVSDKAASDISITLLGGTYTEVVGGGYGAVGQNYTGNISISVYGDVVIGDLYVGHKGNAGFTVGTADVLVDGGKITGALRGSDAAGAAASGDVTVKVTNNFEIADSFEGFFGADTLAGKFEIYLKAAYTTFAEGKGDIATFSAVYDMRADIDDDGEIANDDITIIIRRLAGHDTGYGDIVFDINGDSKINNRDAIEVITAVAYATTVAYAQPTSYAENASLVTDEASLPVFASEPAPGEASITTYEEFIYNLALLEELASIYVQEYPAKDPLALVIKYIRTGVDRYNTGSWGIMAGQEDADFAQFVAMMEADINSQVEDGNYFIITGLKNIAKFDLPNGDHTDIGHMFGSMDITYHNKGSINHADVSGWAGDLVDLLEFADSKNPSGDLEAQIKYITKNLFGAVPEGAVSGFSTEDFYGDLDAFFIMETLYGMEYSNGVLTGLCLEYFTEELTNEARAEFFLKNRLGTTGTRSQIRTAVYNEYTANKLIATLEGTREFGTKDLSTLRRAVCYSFGDVLCKLAGDYVEKTDNPYYEVFNSTSSTLAPGVTQEINYATSSDGKQMVYFLATADITRDDLTVYANYGRNDPTKWAMVRVLDQANAAQEKYGNPESEYYIPNYNVIASINGDGYNMATGEPGGLLVMNGTEYHGINANGFFGITKDGKAIIGTRDEYNNIYRGELRDGIGAFGTTLIKDGKIAVTRTDSYYTSRATRTAVGITATGKVVFMVLDGRQEPYSCGGSMEEIAQIMFDAGCVYAVNLDGGGSSTFVAKAEGEDELKVLNSPSDGAPRSVSTSLMMVSTAPSSTAFDHAKIESDYDYLTIGTELKLTPVGISATGNVAELPEGYTWAVSDSRWGSISDDGVFKALRYGDVEVFLMLGDEIIGRKTFHVVAPSNIYYTRENIGAVYGQALTLPIAAIYDGKKVAINPSDITFVCSPENAGVIDGFVFVGTEGTGVKNVKITAVLASNQECTATITVNLYKQGENSFDFDKATGGDRQLAFDRQVSNTTTDDKINYTVVDSSKDMVTSYIFAMDMTQIPIPEVLSDLIYMLPGADMEGASAWNFLLQLAERVSPLTEVTPTLQFDPDFDVDYSGLTIMTDYFTLKETIFDEKTNTLTLKLNWIDQTQAIDPATANSLCLVSGIKLTPKADADWGSRGRLDVLHSGYISYNIFLRASALYSFAQKPENQEKYGLMPYRHPTDAKDSGASFGDVYKNFSDTYTLIKELKNGWYNEDGGFAYYVNGERSFGVCKVDGYWYDFGENGVNVGQTKFSGLFYHAAGKGYLYAKNGELMQHWQQIGGDWHYFDPNTKYAVKGERKIGGITYDFYDNGKVVSGKWIHTSLGVRYYYGPTFHYSRWQYIDGEWYYFREGYRVTGYSEVYNREASSEREWHDFGDDGIDRGFVPDGILYNDGVPYFIKNGVRQIGLCKWEGNYYFFSYSGIVKNQQYYAWQTNCDLPCANYEFDAEGKIYQGIVEKDGKLIYYVNGATGPYGLTKIDGEYYFVYWSGVIKTGKQYPDKTNCDLPANRNYEFGADGKMLRGIIEKDGKLIYYKNGMTGTCGLKYIDGAYYYVYWGGVIKTGKQFPTITYCDLPANKNYEFGEDGKMLHGIYEIDGKLIYYKYGITGTYGLEYIEGEYYFVSWGGVIKTGIQSPTTTYCDLPAGTYEFAADGKMLRGFVEKNGAKYYYANGNPAPSALTKIDGDYYYIGTAGAVMTGKQKVGATLCDLPAGTYEFGADGKMLGGIVDKNGTLYYYDTGKLGTVGLYKVGDDYYCINWSGAVMSGTQYVSKSYCELGTGLYEFGADGKMLDGLVEKADGIYYYVNGKKADAGLTKIGDDYYYVGWSGAVMTGKVYATSTNCDLPTGTYEFGADGKILNGFVEKNGTKYYYANGKANFMGLIVVDGALYYVSFGGEVVCSRSMFVTVTNGHVIEKTYKFDSTGKLVF